MHVRRQRGSDTFELRSSCTCDVNNKTAYWVQSGIFHGQMLPAAVSNISHVCVAVQTGLFWGFTSHFEVIPTVN